MRAAGIGLRTASLPHPRPTVPNTPAISPRQPDGRLIGFTAVWPCYLPPHPINIHPMKPLHRLGLPLYQHGYS